MLIDSSYKGNNSFKVATNIREINKIQGNLKIHKHFDDIIVVIIQA